MARGTFDEIWFDRAVYGETAERGKQENRADASALEDIVRKKDSKIRIKTEDAAAFAREKMWFVGPGETSVYVLSSGRKDAIPITSDRIAKNKFERRGIAAIRTDEMIFASLEAKKISRDEFIVALAKLREVGGTTSERIALLMKKAEEIR